MREIKFRAWEKNLKEMIPVYDIDLVLRQINTDTVWRKFDEIELMQYTGLKDSNGKEIYVGDICLCDRNINDQSDKRRFIVEFQGGSYFLDSREERIYLHDLDETQELIEVIGNIYENSELLEEVKK